MNAMPTFSILTAAFNASSTIAETIRSVVDQTFEDWELVIVDDGSTDGTYKVARQAADADPRIRILQQTNGGTASARNHAYSHATGTWIVLLDADDLLLPEYLEQQLKFIGRYPERDIYSCNAWMLLRDGSRRLFWRSAQHRSVMELVAEDQIIESGILLMTVMSRRVWDLTGGFRDLHSEDYDFWLRALLRGARHVYSPQVLAVYRRREGTKTTALVQEAESFLRILEDAKRSGVATTAQDSALDAAIAFAHARVLRRGFEERILAGDLRDARGSYWRSRGAFPSRLKFILGLAIVVVSPRAYARLKAGRML